MLRRAVDSLSPRERQIMELRFRPFGRGGAYAEGSGGYDRHFPKLHFKAGKAHHQTAERRFGTHFLNRTNVKRGPGNFPSPPFGLYAAAGPILRARRFAWRRGYFVLSQGGDLRREHGASENAEKRRNGGAAAAQPGGRSGGARAPHRGNLRLVLSVIQRFSAAGRTRTTCSKWDVLAYQAIDHFDVEQGVQFSTYGVP